MIRARATVLVAVVACASPSTRPVPPSGLAEPAPVWSRDEDLLSASAVLVVDDERIPGAALPAFATKLEEVLRGVRAVHAKTGEARASLVVRAPSLAALEHAPVLVRLPDGAAARRGFGEIRTGGAPPVGVVRIAEDELFSPGRPETRPASRSAFDRARGPHALLLVLREPGAQEGLRGDALWDGVRRLRFTVTLTAEEEADARLEIETDDATSGRAFAMRLEERVRRIATTPLVQTATRGLLDGVRVSTEPSDPSRVTATVHATRPQLVAVLNLGAALSGTGASLPEPKAP